MQCVDVISLQILAIIIIILIAAPTFGRGISEYYGTTQSQVRCRKCFARCVSLQGQVVMIIFIALCLFLSFILALSGYSATPDGDAVQVIGYIIPGLIAIWLDRQGVIETLAAMITASVVVRLILILVVGMEYGT